MAGELVGRDDELRYLHDFLDRTTEQLRALVLEGKAGVGKSTLWAAGVASAEQRGFQLRARPWASSRKELAAPRRPPISISSGIRL